MSSTAPDKISRRDFLKVAVSGLAIGLLSPFVSLFLTPKIQPGSSHPLDIASNTRSATAQVVAHKTSPGCIIQSDFPVHQNPWCTIHNNFEAIVLEGPNLVHYFHENNDLRSIWKRAKTVTHNATGPGCIIQSDFRSSQSSHGNFEVVVLEGNNLVHYFLDNGNPDANNWQPAQVVSNHATGPGCIIQSDFRSRDRFGVWHGNFEVVVLEGNNLVHYFRRWDSDRWERAKIISTSATGAGSIIQSNLGNGASLNPPLLRCRNGNFEVVVQELIQSAVYYFHNNANFDYPWIRPWLGASTVIGPVESLVYNVNNTRKVVQLTGNFDREFISEQLPKGKPTINATGERAGAFGMDNGVSFVHRGRIYFLFGDTYRRGPDDGHPKDERPDLDPLLDSMAFTTSPTADEGIPLTFYKEPPRISGFGISQGGSEVPVEGFSANGKMYVFFATHSHPEYSGFSRSLILTKLINAENPPKDPLRFSALYRFPGRKFINVSVHVVENPFTIPGLPAFPSGLLIWGSGRFRASDVYLAYSPLDRLEDPTSIVYYAGSNGINNNQPRWSSSERDAVPILSSGCVGELSVRWNDYLSRWIMLYRNDNPFGIVSRTAELPWGPWTTPSVIFSACENRAYGRFMHCGGETCCGAPQPRDLLSDPRSETTYGSEYAPYQIAPYATGVRDQYTKIYFTLSTWNPYQVMQMETIIPADR